MECLSRDSLCDEAREAGLARAASVVCGARTDRAVRADSDTMPDAQRLPPPGGAVRARVDRIEAGSEEAHNA